MLLAVEGRLGPYSTGKVYCSLISACEELGDLRRAAEWTEATTQWARQHPFAIFPGICRVHRASILDHRGELASAEREAAQACEELLATHLPNAVAAFREVGDIRRRLGDFDAAEEAFRRAEQLSGSTCGGVALLRLAQGRIADAQRIINGCLTEQPPHRAARARLLLAAIQVAVAADDLTTAAECVGELESIAQTYDGTMLAAMALTARGRLELARHEPAAAAAALRSAVALWQQLDVPYEVATAKTALAQALRDSGDEAGADELFVAAREMFDQIGARADLMLPRQGRASEPRPGGLTVREVEVLQLLAEGQSNKEIAGVLQLSTKTVSRHLSNIFTKIGVSSRAAATAFAYEHELVGRRR
jgi:ATP/maltotriose-dependent transcriptional regulator MalT